MSKNNKKQSAVSANETKSSLQRLHAYFNEQARTIRSALELIDALETTIAEKDHEIAVLKMAAHHAAVLAKLENTKVTFLIDGSSSMSMKVVGQQHSFLEAALGSAQQFYHTAAQKQVSALLFGNTGGATPVDLADSVATDKIKKTGLRCGTDLYSSLAGFTPGKEKEHLLIIGDGDTYNTQKIQKTLEELLANNKNLSVDFIVVFNRSDSAIKKLQESIAISDPDRKPQFVLADHQQGQAAVMQAILRTLESRIEQKSPPARKTSVLPKIA